MLRIGIISQLGEEENLGYARVLFEESDLESAWLPLPSLNTLSTKHWIPVEVNSQVACVMDSACEQGFIAMVLWSEEDRPPAEWAGPDTYGILFSDGSEFYYNTAEKVLTVNAPESELSIRCAKLRVEGEIEVEGNIGITGDIEIEGNMKTSEGNVTIEGELTVTEKVDIGGELTVKEKVTTGADLDVGKDLKVGGSADVTQSISAGMEISAGMGISAGLDVQAMTKTVPIKVSTHTHLTSMGLTGLPLPG